MDADTEMKGLLKTRELYEYLLKTTVEPREAEALKELRIATSSHPMQLSRTAPDAGQLIALLLRLINAKKTIELGVYTGYSLLLAALTIPDDGQVYDNTFSALNFSYPLLNILNLIFSLPISCLQIIAIDKDAEAYKIGLPIIKKAGVEHKINFVHSPALPVLDKLLDSPDNLGAFDFAYIDADKNNYLNYHERLLKLVRVGGLLVYDNTLWGGSVAMPETMVRPDWLRASRPHAIKFNEMIAADSRLQIAQVAAGDGVTICMRLH